MFKYSAPYARMRGIKGKLLEKAQLESLLSAPDTQAVITVLNSTIYGEQIRDSVDVTQVEHNLKQDLILSYVKILNFLSGKSADFAEILLNRFELMNVKSIIRSLSQKPIQKDSAKPFIFSLGRYHTIPIEKVLEANDMESFIALMKRTPFKRPLEIGYKRYETEGKLFPLELALDIDYYERVWQAMSALGPMDKHNVSRFLGMQYDIINLLWMLRFKEYYKLLPEQIIQYIIPHGWKINRNTFWNIVSDSDITGAIIAHHVNPYDSLLKTVTQIDGSFTMGAEICLVRYLYHECLLAFMKSPLQMISLMAFFMFKEMQIRDIVTILSGRNLGLSQERIRTYMITL